MFDRIKEFIKSPRFGEIFRFGVNGGVCFLVDYVVMTLCYKAFQWPEWLSVGLGFTVSVILNYILCLVWVFKDAGKQSLKSQLIFIGSSIIGSFNAFCNECFKYENCFPSCSCKSYRYFNRNGVELFYETYCHLRC